MALGFNYRTRSKVTVIGRITPLSRDPTRSRGRRVHVTRTGEAARSATRVLANAVGLFARNNDCEQRIIICDVYLYMTL